MDVWLDGEMLLDPYLDETTDWTDATLAIEGNGPHRVEFRFWNGGGALADCVYLDQVSWTPVRPASVFVEDIEIPVSWLDEEAATIVAECGGDYEAAANADAANGRPVWECYVADLDPEDPDDDLIAGIEIVDGEPEVMIERGESANRAYTVQGAKTLGGGWTDLEDGADWDAAGYRFFRVKVSLPE